MPSILTKAIRANPRLQAALSRARVALLSPLPSSDRRPDKVGPTTDWADARPGIQVPQAQVFRDIRIVPTRRFAYRNKIADGGPVWPDFETNTVVRHLNHRQFVDSNAVPWQFSGPKLRGPMVWGGRCLFHFGHLAAEHMNRLPASLYQHPRAPVVFALPPHQLIRDVPGYFWKIAAWFGAAPQQVHFITRPFIAEELYVSPQVEEFSPIPSPDWYLDLLDELPRLNGIEPIPYDALYVHRLGFVGIGQGGHAPLPTHCPVAPRAGPPPPRWPGRPPIPSAPSKKARPLRDGPCCHDIRLRITRR
ncbi:hypothetical protein SAMN05421641_1212 [Paracoccus thiocyanatus]|uniref:Uncharacterized protein n=1 Tax=Paracoccus thiocyanatus TaxID=34006 RepID=A0A1N6XGF9_9RHOB|nr:hypothetical protein [Paracoccus thiocyanatus]SIR01383.1 hypothetical protein SAMN05421641_1212 [Paracoccus thiocyanatus]